MSFRITSTVDKERRRFAAGPRATNGVLRSSIFEQLTEVGALLGASRGAGRRGAAALGQIGLAVRTIERAAMTDVRFTVRKAAVTARASVLLVQVGQSVGVVDHYFAAHLAGCGPIGTS